MDVVKEVHENISTENDEETDNEFENSSDEEDIIVK